MDQSVAMPTLKGGFLKNAFFFLLEKRYPKDFAKMLARIEKCTNTEEAWAQHGELLDDKPQENKKNGRDEQGAQARRLPRW